MSTKHPARKSTRIPGFEYDQPGHYFITICCANGSSLFGRVENFSVRLSPLGELVNCLWLERPKHHAVNLDQFVVMPNHFHAIVEITEHGRSLGEIVGAFKSECTRVARERGLCGPGMQLWQRGFYDSVLRTEERLFTLRQYVLDNPIKWDLDEYNPRRKP